MNKLTDHGDHFTTGEQTRAGWLSIIVEPQQGLDGVAVYKAHGWRHGELVTSSDYTTTPEAAALEVYEHAQSLPTGWCADCGCDLDEPAEFCDECNPDNGAVSRDDYIERAPEFAEPLVRLWNWSHNFSNFAPFTMMLDLTGFSANENDGDLHNWSDRQALGSIELRMLAEALTAWDNHPASCAEWVRGLLLCDN